MTNLPPIQFIPNTPSPNERDLIEALRNARPVHVVLTAEEAGRFARTLDGVVRKLDFGRARAITDGERELLRCLRDRLQERGMRE